ncbi:hypothetical protein PANDA_006109 [Ailuropoda melanoleuca]|uniref:Uncharacterized protein n=1 Tax=Ailuropoda melanoleuca TaxID=9646 RepID=D2H7I5_AILME|nr:hypothetical protein PANDA_006109 [Ailuropoda melanoleuca]
MTYDLGALEHALTLRGYLTQPTRGRSLVEQGAMSEMPLKTQEIVGNRGALWVEDCIIQTFDVMKDECSLLKLQLKERDELIAQLQEELEKVQHLQKAFASRVDKSTQTELLGYDYRHLIPHLHSGILSDIIRCFISILPGFMRLSDTLY